MRVSGVWGTLLALSMLLGGTANAGTDPVAVDPNTGANFNRYAYANNNPYRFVDPDGRQSRDLESISRQAETYLQTPGGNGPNLITWGAAEVLCGFCDLNYRAPNGSGALQPVAAPWEALVPMRGALGAGARGADRAADAAGGFRGSKGFELSNAPYQPVRNTAGEE